MHLEDQARPHAVLAQALIDTVHCNLDNVRRSSLNRRVHRDTLPEGTLHEIRRSELRNRPSAPEHRRHVSVLFRVFHHPVKKLLDARICLEILLNVLLRFFPRDTEILAQTERTDSVYNAEIDRFCVPAQKRGNFLRLYMKHLRGRYRMDILCILVCLDQLVII